MEGSKTAGDIVRVRGLTILLAVNVTSLAGALAIGAGAIKTYGRTEANLATATIVNSLQDQRIDALTSAIARLGELAAEHSANDKAHDREISDLREHFRELTEPQQSP